MIKIKIKIKTNHVINFLKRNSNFLILCIFKLKVFINKKKYISKKNELPSRLMRVILTQGPC